MINCHRQPRIVTRPMPPANHSIFPPDDNSQPPDIRGWKVYVVDAHSLIFQVFHALPAMASPQGEEVGAVYGFARDLLFLIEKKQPDALLCAFDPPGPTFRHELYTGYKADRGEMPEELASQIPKIQDLLAALRIPVLLCPTYEADDVVATLARMCDQQYADCYLVSGDKDCRQLLTDHVKIYNIRKNEVFDQDALAQEWGIRPAQVVDFQALVGDKVDNVPGVPLIGPKIASELLNTYGTLDKVLENAVHVKGTKRSQNLQQHRDLALLSRDLVRLVDNVPVTLDWNAGRVGGFDHQHLSELLAEYGFRTLALRFGSLQQGAAPEKWEADYRLIDTEEKLQEFLRQLRPQSLISVDTETTHVLPRWAELVGLSFAWNPGEAYYLPLKGPIGDRLLDPAAALEALRPVLEDPQIAKLGQNLKYDMVVLRKAGIRLAGCRFDTMVASYLLNPGERSHSLDELAKRYLNHTTISIEQLIGRGRQQKRMDEVPVAEVAPYASEDADVPLRLKPILANRLAQLELSELSETLEMPLIEVLAELEYTGIRVDPARLSELSDRYGQRQQQLEQEIEELAGHSLNIGSPRQLAQVLFTELKLPVIRKTKTGPSTDVSVLEELAAHHPLPAKVIEYRQYAKLKNTYVDALPELIHTDTGRVHASFNQVVAATGRLSSSDPNLQNIPVRTAEGREIRSAFVPSQTGWKLLAADYSQIELRVLAHYSEDDKLCQAFADDADIHAQVASQVYGVEAAEVTPTMRRAAKAVNFGIIYGQSPFGLAKSLGVPQDEAAAFIDSYFANYRGVEQLMHTTLVNCRRNGYVRTILGRRRAIQGVRDQPARATLFPQEGRRQLNLPERTAINTVIQGSAADLIKLAMVAIHRRLQGVGLATRMLLQIHDELVFEVAADQVEPLAQLVRSQMLEVLPLRVPLKVDIKWGDNWADCEPWHG